MEPEIAVILHEPAGNVKSKSPVLACHKIPASFGVLAVQFFFSDPAQLHHHRPAAVRAPAICSSSFQFSFQNFSDERRVGRVFWNFNAAAVPGWNHR
jgi:hypothetical protein